MAKKKSEKASISKQKFLVIVESPTKAKTISGILGSDYDVTSSMGHIVDLPSSKLAVDVEHDFAPQYRTISGKEKMITQLKSKAKGKEIVYLATDPDREGEAISWHIREKLMDVAKEFKRVTFHEITDSAVKEAIANPTDLDQKKINAQTARRVLDRLVGYNLSPLLWKKIVRGLSAGRVQSVALKFIVDREAEIAKFKPVTTYSVEARFKYAGEEFTAKLSRYNDAKNPIFAAKEEAMACLEAMKGAQFSVGDIAVRENYRKPLPPFTTSLLQQDAYSRLKFSSKKTMFVAQKLYEGVELGGVATGLITYMRTDSFYINPKAKQEAKDFITATWGKQYLPEKDNAYKEKKGAQMAHEAIRPSSANRVPEQISEFLTPEENRLYDLIWRRFLASLMPDAVFKITKVVIDCPLGEFTADGKKMVFDGYMRVYPQNDEDKALPDLHAGDQVEFLGLEVREHTTKPPARYNDASLVKLMEEKGIGRPSTYAPTISTLVARNYVKRERGAFFPSELGIKASHLLTDNFSEVINEDFTAAMEEKLDKVEEGGVNWVDILKEFYPPFKQKVDSAGLTIKKDVVLSGKICPKCGANMIVKWSRKGEFLSCEKFPECKHAESITTDVACPGCKVGLLVKRRNQRGQFFYGCNKFPECRFTSRSLPKEKDGQEAEGDSVQDKEEKGDDTI